MLQISADQYVNSSIDDVFERVCEKYYLYQPIWDPAIVETTQATGDRAYVGARAEITRKYRNRTESGSSSVDVFEAGYRIVVTNRFRRSSETRDLSCHTLAGGGTRLHLTITSEVRGLARLIAPMTSHMLERALIISLFHVKLVIEKEVGKTNQ